MSRIMAEEQYTAWSVHIRSFSGPFFPAFGLNMGDTPYLSEFSTNEGKYGPEKLQMRTLFSYWYSWMLVWCLHHCAWLVNFSWSESYSEPCQRSKMKRFANPLPSSPFFLTENFFFSQCKKQLLTDYLHSKYAEKLNQISKRTFAVAHFL